MESGERAYKNQPLVSLVSTIADISTVPQVTLHNTTGHPERNHAAEEVDSTLPGTTATSSTVASSSDIASEVGEGTWGERDVGGPVNQTTAMEDYERMEQELFRLSLERSKSSTGEKPGLLKTLTRQSFRSKRTRRSSNVRSQSVDTMYPGNEDEEKDLESGNTRAGEDDFKLGDFMRNGYLNKHNEAGISRKKVGVVFKNLTVKGTGSKMTFVRTLPDAILGSFGPDLYHLLRRFIPSLNFGRHPITRNLIHDFTGVVRDGEMMLVLGKPGSGCSTFLKTIANYRGSFTAVTGDVSYGGIPAEKQLKQYRGEVSYNPEDDAHFPTLNVWQTLKFSLLNKTRKRAKGEIDVIITALLKMFSIEHTSKTPVGELSVVPLGQFRSAGMSTCSG